MNYLLKFRWKSKSYKRKWRKKWNVEKGNNELKSLSLSSIYPNIFHLFSLIISLFSLRQKHKNLQQFSSKNRTRVRVNKRKKTAFVQMKSSRTEHSSFFQNQNRTKQNILERNRRKKTPSNILSFERKKESAFPSNFYHFLSNFFTNFYHKNHIKFQKCRYTFFVSFCVIRLRLFLGWWAFLGVLFIFGCVDFFWKSAWSWYLLSNLSITIFSFRRWEFDSK